MKLSIIIPSIGREGLKKVLQAIKECDGFAKINPEILVVFDAEDFSSKFSEFKDSVTFYTTDKKLFAAGARNIGMDKATGDVFVFIGDDTIPRKDWLQKQYDFHNKNEDPKIAFLGKVSWTKELAEDPLHQWLLNHGQFEFKRIEKNGATWRHFYTSNISVKKDFVGTDRFSYAFEGWGFEDGEFGYRLSKKNIHIVYDASCEVFHDHPQTFEKFLENVKNARKNAFIFQKLHPELRILPRRKKLLLLRTMIFIFWLGIPFSQKIRWWRQWKKTWIGDLR